MEAAYVFIQTAGVSRQEVVGRLRQINGVKVARSVSGPFDIVVFAVAPHDRK